MTWFDIVKTTNPHSLYSKEEIKEMIKKLIRHKEIYGNEPVKYYGNFESLGNLRADYDLEFFGILREQYNVEFGNRVFNYWIKEIEFELDIEFVSSEHGKNRPHPYIWVYAINTRGAKRNNITPQSYSTWKENEETLKLVADFVEIYNKPNHRYKNLVATLAAFDKDELKELIEKWKDKIKFVKILEGLNL